MDLAAEGPGGELNAAARMDHETFSAIAAAGGHAERVGHQDGRLGAFDRPADGEPRERVEDDAAAELLRRPRDWPVRLARLPLRSVDVRAIERYAAWPIEGE